MNQGDRLKAKYGEDYYRNIRKKVKSPGYYDKISEKERVKFASEGGKARWKKHEDKQTAAEHPQPDNQNGLEGQNPAQL